MPSSSSPDETILDRLRAHAEASPDRLAYRFLRDDGRSDTFTFGQLAQRVRGLAARLLQEAAPGDRALLLYPPGLAFIETFLACLAAQIIAVPAYPPRRNRKDERLLAILSDAQPRLILTTRKTLPTVEHREPGNARDLLCLATDEIETGTEDRPLPSPAGSTIALLQYTSGSTGTPRGVIITHDNLIANERAIQAAFRHTQESVCVNWLPTFHDMGLIGNILQPLFVGFPSVLLSPTAFLQEPVRWLRAITKFRATTAGAPNFAYDHCVRSITEEQKQGLDLRSWRVAYNGAEPVRAETLDRFAETFESCGFRRTAFFPCYGLAEATLFVAGGPAGEGPRSLCLDVSALESGQVVSAEVTGGRWLISSGRVAEETTVVAVDSLSRAPVPEGRIGELWVASPGVASGYWGQEEAARSTFGRYLASGEGPFLSTGDLGFLEGDAVFVTGRSKDLIILRGQNIYPQDVEAALERALPFVGANSCAAFAFEEEGQERLGIVIEADRWLARLARTAIEGNGKAKAAVVELTSTVSRVRQVIGDAFEIPVHSVTIVRPGSFPRTSSGKVQRRACREGMLAGTLQVLHAWKEPVNFRAVLHEALVRHLQGKQSPQIQTIDHDIPITSQGLDSVSALALVREVEKATGVFLSPELIFELGTINRLAEYLAGRSAAIPAPAVPAPAAGQSLGTSDPLTGSMAEFSNPTGKVLEDRVAAFHAWRTRRRAAGVWPFCRLARSPAAPGTTVSDEEGIARDCINFASQDYLGLARDPRLLRRAQEAIAEYGVHSAGSPVLLGTTTPMAELERALADVLGKEDCLVFPTGWAAGFGAITGLVRGHDTLVLDALCHRCLMEGGHNVSREPRLFRHNDLDHLEEILRQARERDPANGLFVVAESLYSMDSDSPDLPALVRLVRQFDAILILDVAHDFGAMGARGLGLLEQLDGTGLAVDIIMGSFSKTFASTGGFIAADEPVVEYLRGHATSFVYSNAISPVQAATALECCKIAFSNEGQLLRNRLSSNVHSLRSALQTVGCRVSGTPSPIVPVLVGGEREARLTARALARNGLLANLVEYPAVPRGQARFRFQVMSTHTPEMGREAAARFASSLRRRKIREEELSPSLHIKDGKAAFPILASYPLGNTQDRILCQLREWVVRFQRLGSSLPDSEFARHHLVWALSHEGSALVALALGNDIEDQKIRTEIAPARALQRAAPFVCRLQDWPRGYPGDFETIKYLCGQENRADAGTIGWYIETMTLNTPIAQQHRNKVARQAARIAELATRKPDSRILIVACGGIPHALQVLPILERSRCRLILNDMDADALAFCRERLSRLGDRVEYVHGNVMRCARRLADHGLYDLILCGGLFDYLPDRQVSFLLRELLGGLSNSPTEPGRLFFTNIRAGNPYRPWMEYFASWRLIERSQADLLALLEEVGCSPSGVSIATDATGLTWLVEVSRCTTSRFLPTAEVQHALPE